MGKEYERKYKLTQKAKQLICTRYPQLTSIAMETSYFDTQDFSLAARHWTLRRRMEDGQSVCTLKTPGENGMNGEWETECDDIVKAIPKLIGVGAPHELEALTAAGLINTCGAKFTRKAALIAAGHGLVELAVDEGTLFNATGEVPLLELEIELKRGSHENADAFGDTLSEEYALEPEPLSKFYRAFHAGDRQ